MKTQSMEDYGELFDELGITEEFPLEDEVKKRWKRKVLDIHPDKNTTNADKVSTKYISSWLMVIMKCVCVCVYIIDN